MFFKNRELARQTFYLCALSLWIAESESDLSEQQLRTLAMRIVGTSTPQPPVNEVMTLLMRARKEMKEVGRPTFLSELADEVPAPERSTQLKRLAEILRVQPIIGFRQRENFLRVAQALSIDAGEAGFVIAAVELSQQLRKMDETDPVSPVYRPQPKPE